MNNLPDYNDYKDSLVAFIDIIGFNNRARDISDRNDFFEIAKLLYSTQKNSRKFI